MSLLQIGAVGKVPASQSIDSSSTTLSRRIKDFDIDIYSLAFNTKRIVQKQKAGSCACCVLEENAYRDSSIFMWQSNGGPSSLLSQYPCLTNDLKTKYELEHTRVNAP